MFHVDLLRNTQVTSELSRYQSLDYVSFIKRYDVCTKQDQEREQGIQLPVLDTLIDHHTCHSVRPLGCHVKNGSFSLSSMNCMSMNSITEVFYDVATA